MKLSNISLLQYQPQRTAPDHPRHQAELIRENEKLKEAVEELRDDNRFHTQLLVLMTSVAGIATGVVMALLASGSL